MSIQNCRIIQLPKISDPRGNLSFVEGTRHIPFEIKRIFYLYEIADGESRGGHAHKICKQFVIPIHGQFDIFIDDGINKKVVTLSQSDHGLYLPPMVWCELDNFSVGSVCMVLTSDYYDEADYYRNYDEFLAVLQEADK